MGKRRLGAALVLLLVVFSTSARAWIFHEHWRITETAIDALSGPEHAELLAVWADLRRDPGRLLCVDPIHYVEGKDGAPQCISFGMLPAIAGDHSCSPPELARFFDDEKWLMRVVEIG